MQREYQMVNTTWFKQNLASIFTWIKGPEAFQITEITIMVVLSSGVEFRLLRLLMTAMSTKKRPSHVTVVLGGARVTYRH